MYGANEFQFPSNGKAYPKPKGDSSRNQVKRKKFQFPSNGKAYPKLYQYGVSAIQSLFQFPSNGKAYPKNHRCSGTYAHSSGVSIPFQRESLSKEYDGFMGRAEGLCFNSLPTGKPIQSGTLFMIASALILFCFNSLPTGKPIQSQGRAVSALLLC